MSRWTAPRPLHTGGAVGSRGSVFVSVRTGDKQRRDICCLVRHRSPANPVAGALAHECFEVQPIIMIPILILVSEPTSLVSRGGAASRVPLSPMAVEGTSEGTWGDLPHGSTREGPTINPGSKTVLVVSRSHSSRDTGDSDSRKCPLHVSKRGKAPGDFFGCEIDSAGSNVGVALIKTRCKPVRTGTEQSEGGGEPPFRTSVGYRTGDEGDDGKSRPSSLKDHDGGGQWQSRSNPRNPHLARHEVVRDS